MIHILHIELKILNIETRINLIHPSSIEIYVTNGIIDEHKVTKKTFAQIRFKNHAIDKSILVRKICNLKNRQQTETNKAINSVHSGWNFNLRNKYDKGKFYLCIPIRKYGM